MTLPEWLWNNTISFSCYWIHLAHINVHANDEDCVARDQREVEEREDQQEEG